MKMRKLNKRGREYLSIWWIVSFVLATGAIVIAVSTYYSAELDVRQFEADILADSILDCLVENGFLLEETLDEEFDIFERCNINKEVFEGESNFYFNISIIIEEGESLREDIIAGDRSFETECAILQREEGEEVEARYFPVCLRRSTEALYFDNGERKIINIEILAASDQRGGKVPVF